MWVYGESNDDFVNSTIKEIQTCGKYNIPIAIMHATGGNPGTFVFPPNKNALKSMQKILSIAQSLNVKIALENVDKPNFGHFKYLLDNIKSDYLGFCYDVGHHHLYNPKFDILKKYGDRLIAIHIHDNLMDWRYGMDFTRDLHLLPFDGKVNFENVCKKLSKINYNGLVMIEVHKIGLGEPRIYKEMGDIEFLGEALNRANKIKEMILSTKHLRGNK